MPGDGSERRTAGECSIPLSRRELLATLCATGTTSLAGCQGGGSDGTDVPTENRTPPTTGSGTTSTTGNGATPTTERGATPTTERGATPTTRSDAGRTTVDSTRTATDVDRVATNTTAGPTAMPVAVSVDPSDERHEVSPDLMGVNPTYDRLRDVYWSDGRLAQALSDLGVSFVRYPGGEVTDQFHWRDPDGYGRFDRWWCEVDDPPSWAESKCDPLPETEWAGFEEYMSYLDETGGKPLLGINVESGERFSDKLDDSMDRAVREAVDWVEYANVEHGYDVAHWFIGNEQMWGDGKWGENGWSPTRYAEAIERYASAMLDVDSSLQVGMNWENHWVRGYETILDRAGEYVDWLDMHLYWWEASFYKWRQGPMSIKDMTIADKIRNIRSKLDARGREDVAVTVMEWNAFWDVEFKQYPRALMNAEEFMQFVDAGLDAAGYHSLNEFDLSLFETTPITETVNGEKQYTGFELRKKPPYKMLSLFTSVLGTRHVASSADDYRTMTVAMRDGDDLTVYVLQKFEAETAVTVETNGFVDGENLTEDDARVVVFTAPNPEEIDRTTNEAVLEERSWEPTDDGVAFTMPRLSLAKVTIQRSGG